MRQRPAWLTETPVAHRGLHAATAGVPENSLAAFEAAIAAGYGIELDLQLSADGVAMVFHDDDLERLCGIGGRMSERRAEELGRLALLGTAETIPTLRRTLDAVASRAPLLIELKTLGLEVGPLEAAAWHELQAYTGRFAIQSFEPGSVTWFHRHAPAVCRGQISGPFRRGGEDQGPLRRFLLRHLLLSWPGRPDFIAYDVNALDEPALKLARALGLPVLTWTVRTEAQLTRARALADNVIFEQIRP
jgi:glycerophosphoryl diester phosphodiesterase